MATPYDTVCKEVVPSDGDDHQLQDEISLQLQTTANPSEYYPNLRLYKRISTENHYVTGHSDIESNAGPEYQATPTLWHENEERESSRERRRPTVYGDRSLLNHQLCKNLNEPSWQRLKKF